jgi:hypothetical protein
MKKQSLGALIALNGVLLLALLLVLVLPGPAADAQRRTNRGRGDYVMVAGEVTGRTDQSGIYILEMKSYRMAVVMYDSRTNRLQTMAGRNLGSDLEGRGREDRR